MPKLSNGLAIHPSTATICRHLIPGQLKVFSWLIFQTLEFFEKARRQEINELSVTGLCPQKKGIFLPQEKQHLAKNGWNWHGRNLSRKLKQTCKTSSNILFVLQYCWQCWLRFMSLFCIPFLLFWRNMQKFPFSTVWEALEVDWSQTDVYWLTTDAAQIFERRQLRRPQQQQAPATTTTTTTTSNNQQQ